MSPLLSTVRTIPSDFHFLLWNNNQVKEVEKDIEHLSSSIAVTYLTYFCNRPRRSPAYRRARPHGRFPESTAMSGNVKPAVQISLC
jgi:hypothetical protein